MKLPNNLLLTITILKVIDINTVLPDFAARGLAASLIDVGATPGKPTV